MKHYAGIDVSLTSSSVCVVDESGKIVREAKVASERVALINWFISLGLGLERIGLEAGPLSQWLNGALRESGLPVELLEALVPVVKVESIIERAIKRIGPKCLAYQHRK